MNSTLVRGEAQSFRWDRVTAASALAYCVLVTGLSTGLVLGELRDQLHLSGTVTALHGCTFGVGMLVAATFGDRAVARFGRARVFWTACVSIIVGLIVFCIGTVVAVTLFGATIAGFSAAAVVLVQPGLIADHHGENRSAAFAAVNAYPALCGVTVAVAIGLAIGADVSWRWTFFAFGTTILAALLVIGRHAALPKARVTNAAPAWRMLRDPVIRRAWGNLTIAIMVEFPIAVWATVYLKEVGGSSNGAAPILSSTFGLMMFCSRLLMPALHRRLEGRLREWALAGTGLGAVLLWAMPSLPGKVMALAMVGFAAGPLYTTSVDRMYAVAPGTDAQGMGALAALASGTAVTTAPLALGMIADIVGLRLAVLIVPVLAGVALLMRFRQERAAVPATATA